MEEALYIKTDKKPTLLNQEMAIGALLLPTVIGLGTFAAGAAVGFPLLLGALGVGAGAGALLGMARMRQEQVTGKKIDRKASIFNKDALLAGLLVLVIGAGLTFGVSTLGGAVLGLTGAIPTFTLSGVVAEGAANLTHAVFPYIMPPLTVASALGASLIVGIGSKLKEELTFSQIKLQEGLELERERQSVRTPQLEQQADPQKSFLAELMRQRAQSAETKIVR